MPRQPRFRVPDVPQYVIQSGDPSRPVLYEERDFQIFLQCLDEAAKASGSRVHAYALLPSSVRLLATPSAPNGIPRLMQSLGRRFAQYISDSGRGRGRVWEGRYKAGLVEPGRFVLACYRHVEEAPVRCGLVTAAGRYAWTSRRANAHGGDAPSTPTPHSNPSTSTRSGAVSGIASSATSRCRNT